MVINAENKHNECLMDLCVVPDTRLVVTIICVWYFHSSVHFSTFCPVSFTFLLIVSQNTKSLCSIAHFSTVLNINLNPVFHISVQYSTFDQNYTFISTIPYVVKYSSFGGTVPYLYALFHNSV